MRAAATRGLCGVHYSRLRYSTDAAVRAALAAAALPSRRGHTGPRITGGGARPPGADQGRAADRGHVASPEPLAGRGDHFDMRHGIARPLSVGGFMLAPPAARLTPKQEAERAGLLELYYRRAEAGLHIRTGEPLTAAEQRSARPCPTAGALVNRSATGKARVAAAKAELARLAGPAADRLPPRQREAFGLWIGGLSIRQVADRLGISLPVANNRVFVARRALGLPRIEVDGTLAPTPPPADRGPAEPQGRYEEVA